MYYPSEGESADWCCHGHCHFECLTLSRYLLLPSLLTRRVEAVVKSRDVGSRELVISYRVQQDIG